MNKLFRFFGLLIILTGIIGHLFGRYNDTEGTYILLLGLIGVYLSELDKDEKDDN